MARSVVGSLMRLVIMLFVVGGLIAWRKRVKREKEKMEAYLETDSMKLNTLPSSILLVESLDMRLQALSNISS